MYNIKSLLYHIPADKMSFYDEIMHLPITEAQEHHEEDYYNFKFVYIIIKQCIIICQYIITITITYDYILFSRVILILNK